MIRRSFRVGLTLGILAGLGFALVKMFGGRAEPGGGPALAPTEPWPRLVPDPVAPSPVAPVVEEAVVAPAPAPAPPPALTPAPPPAPAATAPAPARPAAAKAAAKKKPLVAPWVEASGDECPASHPVKAKLSSKIFHLPGMLNYDRTNPDRCYKDPKAAEGDGLRAAKR